MHASLADLYATDPRFAVHFDEVAPGLEQAPEDDDRTGANLSRNLAACRAGTLTAVGSDTGDLGVSVLVFHS